METNNGRSFAGFTELRIYGDTVGHDTERCGDPRIWFPMRVTYQREMKVKAELDRLEIENFIPMTYRFTESRKQGDTELRREPEGWNYGSMEKRNYGSAKRKSSKAANSWNKGSMEIRKESVAPEVRKFENPLKPLMTEAEKAEAQVLELSYDFGCRIIRLYKYLNEGKLSKADRDIVDALGRQLLRSATSINANMNEAQHPQSDADFLSKATIALKESRESETWLHMLSDNGYLDQRMSESILHDCARINKILITITSKVRNRLNR